MYSCEIDMTMRLKNYNIDSGTYAHICKSSPQIKRVRYEPYGNFFEMWTKDSHYWKFTVYRQE